MLNRLNLILTVALVFVLASSMLTRVDRSRPNYQVNLGDDMTYSPAYTPFEANDIFANGRTMQAPVSGTITRGAEQFHFEPTPQDAIRAGEQLANPFKRDTKAGLASAERGKVVFQYFCTSCHGGDGTGNGPVAKRGFPPPPTLLTGKTLKMQDGQLLHILTFGQNSMPNFAAQLPPDRRWDVINYIRLLQGAETQESEVESQTPTADSQEPLAEISPTTEPDSAAPVEADTESNP